MRHLLHLLAALVVAMVFSLPAAAADKAIIVLDASGSMWAQIDGKSRIEIARDALGQVLEGVPDTLELGFMAYGHRTKGDCSDIEMLVEAAPGTADQIVGAAMSLNPRGKTPLSDAVRQAAEQLRFTEDKATVVLITDGIETCNADPCALATELEAAGVDFTVNVVGFGLSADEGAAVQCLADNTGGIYIGADDENGLKDAIDVVVNDTPPPAPEPEPEPEPEPAPVSQITFDPTVVLAEGEDPLVEGEGSVAWEFSRANADGTPGEWMRTEYGNAYQGDIEPGDYIVTARIDNVRVSQPVTIEAGKVATPEYNLNAGRLIVRPIAYEGAEPDSSAAVYLEFANGESTTYYGEAKMFAAAGTTKITITIGSAKLEESVVVAAGDTLVKDIVVGVGRATVNSFYTEGMKVEDGGIFVEILGAKKNINGDRESFAYTYGPDANFDLMPGEYVALARFDAVEVEQPFSVVAGEAVAVEVQLDAGVLFVDAPGAVWIAVFSGKKDIQGNRKEFGGVYDVTSNRTLPAGDYQVVAEYADGSTKEASASVAAGERTEIKVE